MDSDQKHSLKRIYLALTNTILQREMSRKLLSIFYYKLWKKFIITFSALSTPPSKVLYYSNNPKIEKILSVLKLNWLKKLLISILKYN